MAIEFLSCLDLCQFHFIGLQLCPESHSYWILNAFLFYLAYVWIYSMAFHTGWYKDIYLLAADHSSVKCYSISENIVIPSASSHLFNMSLESVCIFQVALRIFWGKSCRKLIKYAFEWMQVWYWMESVVLATTTINYTASTFRMISYSEVLHFSTEQGLCKMKGQRVFCK